MMIPASDVVNATAVCDDFHFVADTVGGSLPIVHLVEVFTIHPLRVSAIGSSRPQTLLRQFFVRDISAPEVLFQTITFSSSEDLILVPSGEKVTERP